MRATRAAGVTAAVAIAVAAFEAFSGEDDPKTALFLVSAVVVVAVSIPLFRFLERRTGTAEHDGALVALVLGAFALVLAPVAFFSGLPIVVGAAGVWSAAATLGSRWQASLGTALAVAAILFTLVMAVVVD